MLMPEVSPGGGGGGGGGLGAAGIVYYDVVSLLYRAVEESTDFILRSSFSRFAVCSQSTKVLLRFGR